MGHPALARPADPVIDPTGPDIVRLVDDMIDTMLDAPGIGLAAPQVCVSKRVVVYYVPEGRDDNGVGWPVTTLVNPKLTPLGHQRDYHTEACLSLPGMSGVVPRYRRLLVEAMDMDGRVTEREVSGFHARVLQHECDHLDGILYPQRMDDLSTFGYTEELIKRDARQEEQTSEDVV